MEQHSENIVKAKDEVIDVEVRNPSDDHLGKICEIMLDKVSGKTVYAVMESGTTLGLGGKLFAIPWNALHFDTEKDCFILNADKEKVQKAPGFDKDNWPDMADKTWGESVLQYYGEKSSI